MGFFNSVPKRRRLSVHIEIDEDQADDLTQYLRRIHRRDMGELRKLGAPRLFDDIARQIERFR